jgi:nucleotide-binding universal stress UspA family protein
MPNTIQHILVAHDFGEASSGALAYAIELAETLKARITIVHAYDIPVYGFPEGLALTADTLGRIESATRQALEGVLRQGPAWSEIVAAAAETKADLVVIGTHGRRGLAHALLGSVAEKVVRAAPCPVLTVRGSGRSP